MKEQHNSLLIKWLKSPTGIVAVVSLVTVGYFLFKEHKAHVSEAMPYILLGLFIIFHFFMHSMHGHGDQGHKKDSEDSKEDSNEHKHGGV